MPSINQFPIPPSVPPEHRGWVQELMTYWLSRFDPRNPQSDFAAGMVAESDGTVTLDEAYPQGRDASVVTLTSRITDVGKASNQAFMPPVAFLNRQSAQNINPVTSTSNATTAAITIASHTIQWGERNLSINGGSIAGAPVDTTLYIYSDISDPESATPLTLTYTYTTNPQTVVAANNRVLIGSIRTAKNAQTWNIAGATQANPCVITIASGPGPDTGDTVAISGVVGMTELNSLPATAVTRISSTQFSLNGVNSTAYGSYVSGGTVTRQNTTAAAGGVGAGWNWNIDIP